jgi:hypothetical protein
MRDIAVLTGFFPFAPSIAAMIEIAMLTGIVQSGDVCSTRLKTSFSAIFSPPFSNLLKQDLCCA